MLIGLTGYKGTGKSTVAQFLIEYHNFTRCAFADPLKEMLFCLGLNHEQLYGKDKEVPTNLLCGQTPRHAMQTLGTEWGRKLIGDQLWIDVMRRRLESSAGFSTVIDDLRFKNEANLIRSMGGYIGYIDRPGQHGDGHESERQISLIERDFIIVNDKTIDDLKVNIWKQIQNLREDRRLKPIDASKASKPSKDNEKNKDDKKNK
jgi:hypothetical protein